MRDRFEYIRGLIKRDLTCGELSQEVRELLQQEATLYLDSTPLSESAIEEAISQFCTTLAIQWDLINPDDFPQCAYKLAEKSILPEVDEYGLSFTDDL